MRIVIEIGRKPSRAYDTHCQDVAGADRAERGCDICYRSPAMVTTLVRQTLAQSPLWSPPIAGVLHSPLRQPSQRLIGRLALGSGSGWSDLLTISLSRAPWPRAASCGPQGRIKPEFRRGKPRIKDAEGKEVTQPVAIQGPFQPRFSASARVVPNPVGERQELLCSVIGASPSSMGIGLVALL